MNNEGKMIEGMSSHEMNLRCVSLVASVINGIVQKYVDKCISVDNMEENAEEEWEKEL